VNAQPLKRESPDGTARFEIDAAGEHVTRARCGRPVFLVICILVLR